MLHAPTPLRPPRSRDDDLDQAVAEYALVRPRLVGIAYRILGNWTEAEDIVQEAWVRWQGYDRSAVRTPAAFLVTTTTRLAINTAQSARARHESYVGQWLPDPVDPNDDTTSAAERSEDLERAILVLLQRLSPTELAAYVLRQAFDYPYARIAEILQLTEANVRQLVSRAGKRIAAEQRQPAYTPEPRRLVHAFVAAARHGDVEALEDVLVAVTRNSRLRRPVTSRVPALS